MPTAGLPYQLSGWDEFEAVHGDADLGPRHQSVREVWWDIRPHPDFGTVELRICDGLPTFARSAPSRPCPSAWSSSSTP